MVNFSVENSFFCGKLFPQSFPHFFHNYILSLSLLTFMTNHFSTLHCEYNFHLCGKLFIFFIYIIFQPLIFNQKLIKSVYTQMWITFFNNVDN